jgi:hypothetical protein
VDEEQHVAAMNCAFKLACARLELTGSAADLGSCRRGVLPRTLPPSPPAATVLAERDRVNAIISRCSASYAPSRQEYENGMVTPWQRQVFEAQKIGRRGALSISGKVALKIPPRHADKLPGGFVVRDATGQALAYVYSREIEAEARQANVLTSDESRRIAANIARLPDLLGKGERE